MGPRTTRLALALVRRLAVALAGFMIATNVQAGDFSTPVSVDIPAQSLAAALTELANQADLQILFPQELVAGVQAPALVGRYSPTEALERLLAYANLAYVIRGRDTVIIRAVHGLRSESSS